MLPVAVGAGWAAGSLAPVAGTCPVPVPAWPLLGVAGFVTLTGAERRRDAH
ncbi:hypothetical protein [Plantactinospora sp. KLBMP9567]|uniref:hypothetical protein n=1 Tax=Plantactinospora sp. KLBMP9567 TaxID=3085900 RepID=UPI002981A61E|nr:hypothetical protein [Plantactinospora sp. KLBMP9567]MDW5323566.1 hypothetical protein [Plantactinospora sp. KLBMP9567]